MIKFITRLVFTFFVLIFSYSTGISQTANLVIDSFGDHKLPGWYWGGSLSMKYSHSTDNLENGYAIISTAADQTANSFAGLIRRDAKIQLVQDNILSLMLQGTSSDLYATVQILFDSNNDGKYDEGVDTRLESKPISLNFSGWKEIHININENELKIFSKNKNEDFSILEQETIGLQLSYTTGKDFKTSKVETGIALIAERPNKEIKQQEAGSNEVSPGESFFNLKNYPNPFNPETTISYALKTSGNLKITVYDRLGREVTVLIDGTQNEGEHTVSFNASNLPSGVYFYRVKTNDKTEVKKMVLAK